MEFNYEEKIPKARIAVLVGKKGVIKRRIEKSLGIKLLIDSDDGDVLLKADDGLNLMAAQNIVKAVGRGFNPEIALKLLKDDFIFDTVDITDYSGSSKKKLITLRSRAIGTEGKFRKRINELTDVDIVIYGKTISLIGNYNDVDLARKGFDSLLKGNRHTTVYAWLENQNRKKERGF